MQTDRQLFLLLRPENRVRTSPDSHPTSLCFRRFSFIAGPVFLLCCPFSAGLSDLKRSHEDAPAILNGTRPLSHSSDYSCLQQTPNSPLRAQPAARGIFPAVWPCLPGFAFVQEHALAPLLLWLSLSAPRIAAKRELQSQKGDRHGDALREASRSLTPTTVRCETSPLDAPSSPLELCALPPTSGPPDSQPPPFASHSYSRRKP